MTSREDKITVMNDHGQLHPPRPVVIVFSFAASNQIDFNVVYLAGVGSDSLLL